MALETETAPVSSVLREDECLFGEIDTVNLAQLREYGSTNAPLFCMACSPSGRTQLAMSDCQLRHATMSSLCPLLPGRLYFTIHESVEETLEEIRQHPKHFFCSTDLHESYIPICDDFGPVHIGSVSRFCAFLDKTLSDERLEDRAIIYYSGKTYHSVANAAFLLAAYLMLEHAYSPEKAFKPFSCMDIPIVPFRDATHAPATFPITIEDCLRGLRKATELGWFAWRGFDVEEYEAMSDPGSGGDMSRICDKFVALRGPEEAPSAEEEVAAHTPRAYAHKLQRCGVTHIVRLNRPDTYHPAAFHPARFRHLDLPFPDCTTPPDPLVARFLSFCDAAHVVAVHCETGLSTTGTMISLWLMSRCGFTAREAITWLRLVRPGSVIGTQQHYLEDMQSRLRCGEEGEGGRFEFEDQHES